MILSAVFFLICLVPLLKVHCLTFPNVAFMGQTLANHSYVDLGQVGPIDSAEGLVCTTDLESCCSASQGPHRGDWYFPNGTRLPFTKDNIYQSRDPQQVVLGRSSSTVTSPSGIYRCEIPTSSVHDHNSDSLKEFVYLGLYSANEGNFEKLVYVRHSHYHSR